MTNTTALTLVGIENELMFALDTIEGMEAADPLRAELELEIAAAVAAEMKKVDGICWTLAQMESQSALASAEIKRLQARKARCERTTERLEGYVKQAMEFADKTRIDGDTSTLRLQANPASVIILDESLVPASYKTHVPEQWLIRKADVAKDLKRNILVPGAEMSEPNTRLVRS